MILLLVLTLVVLIMVLPGSALEFLREEYAWVHALAEFLDTVSPGVDLDHLAAFAALGFAARFGWPSGRAWQVAIGLMGLAALIEFVQLWIPGRVSSPVHGLMDLVGGMAGFGLAWLLTYAWGSEGLGGDSR